VETDEEMARRLHLEEMRSSILELQQNRRRDNDTYRVSFPTNLEYIVEQIDFFVSYHSSSSSSSSSYPGNYCILELHKGVRPYPYQNIFRVTRNQKEKGGVRIKDSQFFGSVEEAQMYYVKLMKLFSRELSNTWTWLEFPHAEDVSSFGLSDTKHLMVYDPSLLQKMLWKKASGRAQADYVLASDLNNDVSKFQKDEDEELREEYAIENNMNNNNNNVNNNNNSNNNNNNENDFSDFDEIESKRMERLREEEKLLAKYQSYFNYGGGNPICKRLITKFMFEFALRRAISIPLLLTSPINPPSEKKEEDTANTSTSTSTSTSTTTTTSTSVSDVIENKEEDTHNQETVVKKKKKKKKIGKRFIFEWIIKKMKGKKKKKKKKK